MAIPLLNSAKMRELDRVTIEEIGIPGTVLMEIAGRGCAEVVEEYFPRHRPGSVAVVCGKGNNGGDGLVAARHLYHAGHRVVVFLLTDPEKLHQDAALNFKILEKLKVPVRVVTEEETLSGLDLREYDVLLDAVFGTGLSSTVRGIAALAIEKINAAAVPVVSVDVPSGLCADTGQPMGTAVRASHTVTFAYPKPGQVLFPGAAFTGDLTVVDIGIPPHLAPAGPGSTWLLTEEDIVPHLGRREPDAHKGRFGHLVVAAGSMEQPGAAGLCCRAAIRSGAGLVTLAAPPEVVSRVVVGAVEFMGAPVVSADEFLSFCAGKQAVALGPGLGMSKEARKLVHRAMTEVALPMVVDADGLNHLVGRLDLLGHASAPRILTPHPGEMARLLESNTAEVQRDRLGAARRLATKHGCVVVLKGAGTVVADADGTTSVITCGNPGMASGGTGDVLTGIIGALLAQGMGADEAAAVGAYVHGMAGDLAAQAKGQRGMVASDLIEALADVLRTFESWQDENDSSAENHVPSSHPGARPPDRQGL